jgi:hypothetical protein
LDTILFYNSSPHRHTLVILSALTISQLQCKFTVLYDLFIDMYQCQKEKRRMGGREKSKKRGDRGMRKQRVGGENGGA